MPLRSFLLTNAYDERSFICLEFLAQSWLPLVALMSAYQSERTKLDTATMEGLHERLLNLVPDDKKSEAKELLSKYETAAVEKASQAQDDTPNTEVDEMMRKHESQISDKSEKSKLEEQSVINASAENLPEKSPEDNGSSVSKENLENKTALINQNKKTEKKKAVNVEPKSKTSKKTKRHEEKLRNNEVTRTNINEKKQPPSKEQEERNISLMSSKAFTEKHQKKPEEKKEERKRNEKKSFFRSEASDLSFEEAYLMNLAAHKKEDSLGSESDISDDSYQNENKRKAKGSPKTELPRSHALKEYCQCNSKKDNRKKLEQECDSFESLKSAKYNWDRRERPRSKGNDDDSKDRYISNSKQKKSPGCECIDQNSPRSKEKERSDMDESESNSRRSYMEYIPPKRQNNAGHDLWKSGRGFERSRDEDGRCRCESERGKDSDREKKFFRPDANEKKRYDQNDRERTSEREKQKNQGKFEQCCGNYQHRGLVEKHEENGRRQTLMSQNISSEEMKQSGEWNTTDQRQKSGFNKLRREDEKYGSRKQSTPVKEERWTCQIKCKEQNPERGFYGLGRNEHTSPITNRSQTVKDNRQNEYETNSNDGFDRPRGNTEKQQDLRVKEKGYLERKDACAVCGERFTSSDARKEAAMHVQILKEDLLFLQKELEKMKGRMHSSQAKNDLCLFSWFQCSLRLERLKELLWRLRECPLMKLRVCETSVCPEGQKISNRTVESLKDDVRAIRCELDCFKGDQY